MKYTGWCQNDFNVQGYRNPGIIRWSGPLVSPPSGKPRIGLCADSSQLARSRERVTCEARQALTPQRLCELQFVPRRGR